MSTIKVVTLNLWGEQPPLAERMAHAVRGLNKLAPDIIALQEVRVVPGTLPNQADMLAEKLGMHWHYEVGTPWGGGEEGLALLSRYPIVERRVKELPHAHEKERRICVGITAETPSGPFCAFTTHLNYRLTDG